MKNNEPRPPSRRLQRVSELLRRELSEILRREFSVERVGVLTVNEVKVSPDLKTATAYVSFVGTKGQRSAAEETLSAQGKRLQALLGPQLSMKWTPVLTFLLDDSIEKGNRVLAILDQLEKGQNPNPRA